MELEGVTRDREARSRASIVEEQAVISIQRLSSIPDCEWEVSE
jgi:hypothetical protein